MAWVAIDNTEIVVGKPIKQTLFQRIKDNLDYLYTYNNINVVVNNGTSTDNAIPKFDLATGKIIQNSGVIIDDSNNLSGIGNITLTGTVDGVNISDAINQNVKTTDSPSFVDITATGVVKLSNGSVSAPSLAFNNALTTGVFYDSSTIKFSVSGNTSFVIGVYYSCTKLLNSIIYNAISDYDAPTIYVKNSAGSAYKPLQLGIYSANNLGVAGFANGGSGIQTCFDYVSSNMLNSNRYSHNIRTNHDGINDNNNYLSIYTWKVGDSAGGYGSHESIRIGADKTIIKSHDKNVVFLGHTSQEIIPSNVWNNTLEKLGLTSAGTSIDASNGGKHIYVINYTPDLHISHDFGKTWTVLSTITGYNFSISCDQTGRYVLFKNKVSSDFGSSFTSLASSFTFVCIAKSNPRYMYGIIITPNTLYKSSDYGVTWTTTDLTSLSLGDKYGISCSYDGKYVLISATTTHACAVSSDFGASFTGVGTAHDGNRRCAMSSNGEKMFISSYNSPFLLKSSNYGVTFVTDTNVTVGHGVECSKNGDIIFVVGITNNKQYSINGGTSWTTITSNYMSYSVKILEEKVIFGGYEIPTALEYLTINAETTQLGKLNLKYSGTEDSPNIALNDAKDTGIFSSDGSLISSTIEGRMRQQIGKNGVCIEQSSVSFVNNVTKDFLDVFVPTNAGVSITIEYTIIAEKSTVVKCHTGKVIMLARKQAGTVTTLVTDVDSHSSEFTASDIAHTFTCVANGSYAKISALFDAINLTDSVDSGTMYYSLRVLGSSEAYINYL